MKKLIFVFTCLMVFIVPHGTFAEEYNNSLYTQYYNSDTRENALPNVMGLAYHTGTAQTNLNASWSTNYYYTDSLDISNYRGGVLKIPFYTMFYPQSQSFNVSDGETGMYCARFRCTNYNNDGVCYYYVCDDEQADERTYNNTFYDNYEPNASYNFRLYYNDSSHWTPCNLEGYNIVCPVPQNANTLYNITVFHKIIGKSTFTYYLALGRGIFVYTNSSGAIIDSQNQTTDAVNDNTNAINGVNDSLTDSSGNTSSDNSNAIQGFENNVASNNTISSLITMPITLYQKILNSVNGSCSTFTLGNLLGTNVTFPCINPSTYLGSSLWSIIDVICSGLLIFSISKRFISIFDGFTSMSTTKDEVGD